MKLPPCRVLVNILSLSRQTCYCTIRWSACLRHAIIIALEAQMPNKEEMRLVLFSNQQLIAFSLLIDLLPCICVYY